MHNYKPNQKARIVTLQIAVNAETPLDEIADEISAVLSENAMTADDTAILDWRYKPNAYGEYNLSTCPIVTLSDDPEEGEAFFLM